MNFLPFILHLLNGNQDRLSYKPDFKMKIETFSNSVIRLKKSNKVTDLDLSKESSSCDLAQQKFKYKNCEEAAEAGDLDELINMRNNRLPWGMSIPRVAAFNGHYDIVKYAHENGCEWDNWVPARAAINGYFDIVKYAYNNGCGWGRFTPAYAAENGHLEILKYVHENGCQWDAKTPAFAARSGNLECLKYARENGCHWDSSVVQNAARNGHLEILKYAHENGLEYDSWTHVDAAQQGHLHIIKYLHENGCLMYGATPINASLYGHFDCFKYCFEKWTSPHDFWNLNFDITKIVDKIDLDDPIWRRLLDLVFNKYPTLQIKLDKKKKELQELKVGSKEVLQTILPLDIIRFCIHPYF